MGSEAVLYGPRVGRKMQKEPVVKRHEHPPRSPLARLERIENSRRGTRYERARAVWPHGESTGACGSIAAHAFFPGER